MAQVLVLGSANADLVVSVPRRPAGGETVLGSDTVVLPGGKGANTAVAAARAGGRVALLGAVGDDGNGALLRRSLEGAGVDAALVAVSRRPTGAAYIAVTPDGENSIVVAPGANADVVAEAPWGRFAVLVCSLEVPVPVVEEAVRAASAAGVRVVLNLSPVVGVAPDVLAALDPLVVNEHEAAELAPSFEGLLELGPRAVVVTLGARGAAVVTRSGVLEVPAPEVDVVDTTGAGDAFAGALAVRLAEGRELVDAVGFAVRVAAFSVTRAGAQPSYPTLAELGGR